MIENNNVGTKNSCFKHLKNIEGISGKEPPDPCILPLDMALDVHNIIIICLSKIYCIIISININNFLPKTCFIATGPSNLI